MTDAGEVRCPFCGEKEGIQETLLKFRWRCKFCSYTIHKQDYEKAWFIKRINRLESALQKIHDRIDGGIVDSEPFYIAKNALKRA